MRSRKQSNAFLGIAVTDNRIEATLVRPVGERFEVVHRFRRQHTSLHEKVATGDLSNILPGLKGSDESDFTIQVGSGGDGGGGAGMFLPGEFSQLEAKKAAQGARGASPEGDSGDTVAPQRPSTFVLQLKELLAECDKAGYPNPEVGFVVAPPHAAYVELAIPREQASSVSTKSVFGKRKEAFSDDHLSKQARRLLLGQLKEKHASTVDEERVALLPMTTFKGQRRYLAVVPEPKEPVAATLEALARKEPGLYPTVEVLDAEVSLYADLAVRVAAPADHETVAVVRVGADDTLVLFLSGSRLRHQERLRSLTSYDAPDTICSRVMLQQDEQKIGEVHHLLLLSEGRSEQALSTFRRYFASAAVEDMGQALDKLGLSLVEEDDEPARVTSLQAAGVALQLAGRKAGQTDAPSVNLLPKRLRRKPRRRLSVAWHTVVMLLALFGVTLFFVNRYLEQEEAIREGRQELQTLNAAATTASVSALRTRADSLQQVHTRYTRAMHVLDSLLVGSDRWSRMLEQTSQTTGALSGVWFESWDPQGAGINLIGNTISRPRVAQLARRLNATIEMTEFAEVNDVRIHPFRMVVPVPNEMPKAAAFLQDKAQQESASISTGTLTSTSGTPPGDAPAVPTRSVSQ